MNLEGYRRAYSFYQYSCIIHMFAIELHKDQKNKLGEPYVLHVERVASNFPEDSLEYLVALLHDTVEDTEITIDNLRYLGLPESVLEAVDAITHRTHEPLVEYYARSYQRKRR
jgi:(p)ppGpp synthase/HD superfamily hydrolase